MCLPKFGKPDLQMFFQKCFHNNKINSIYKCRHDMVMQFLFINVFLAFNTFLFCFSADASWSVTSISSNVNIHYSGNATWLSMAIFRSSCSIDVKYFPYDVQNYTMSFASWSHDIVMCSHLFWSSGIIDCMFVYIWKWSSAHALGGVSGVASFITTDEQL